jgi:hypothetical protein
MTDISDQEWVLMIEPVARELLGEPNKRLSNGTELRFGARGSVSIDLTKGTFYDFETEEGGGVIDLVAREVKGVEPATWLRERGYLPESDDDAPRKPKSAGAPARRVVAIFDYRDVDGTLLFQVLRYEPRDFRQRRPDPTQPDGWSWKTSGIKGCRTDYRK